MPYHFLASYTYDVLHLQCIAHAPSAVPWQQKFFLPNTRKRSSNSWGWLGPVFVYVLAPETEIFRPASGRMYRQHFVKIKGLGDSLRLAPQQQSFCIHVHLRGFPSGGAPGQSLAVTVAPVPSPYLPPRLTTKDELGSPKKLDKTCPSLTTSFSAFTGEPLRKKGGGVPPKT